LIVAQDLALAVGGLDDRKGLAFDVGGRLVDHAAIGDVDDMNDAAGIGDAQAVGGVLPQGAEQAIGTERRPPFTGRGGGAHGAGGARGTDRARRTAVGRQTRVLGTPRELWSFHSSFRRWTLGKPRGRVPSQSLGATKEYSTASRAN